VPILAADVVKVVVRPHRADQPHLLPPRQRDDALHVPAAVHHVALARRRVTNQVDKVLHARRREEEVLLRLAGARPHERHVSARKQLPEPQPALHRLVADGDRRREALVRPLRHRARAVRLFDLLGVQLRRVPIRLSRLLVLPQRECRLAAPKVSLGPVHPSADGAAGRHQRLLRTLRAEESRGKVRAHSGKHALVWMRFGERRRLFVDPDRLSRVTRLESRVAAVLELEAASERVGVGCHSS